MKRILFGLILASGLFFSWACNSSTPTSANGTGTRGSGAPTVTSTPTNLNGYTSTPTATFQATPVYNSSFSVDAPNGIAYGNGLIYVAEGASVTETAPVSEVQVFNASSNALSWIWTNAGGVSFEGPSGVASNSAGTTVYVLDDNPNNGNAVVYALSPAATPTAITSWSSYGTTVLSYPEGIAVDSTGNVYVADSNNGLLEEFTSIGGSVASWSDSIDDDPVVPMAVAVDSSNDVYVADGENYEMWVLNPSSGGSFTVANNWSLPAVPYDGGPPYLAYYGLAVDGSKNVYVADYYNSQVEVYTNTGSQIGLFNGSNGTPLVGPDALLLYNSDIYVGDYDSNSTYNSNGIIEIFTNSY